MRAWLTPLLLVCAVAAQAEEFSGAEEFRGRVIIVLDGDTVMLVRDCDRRGAESPANPLPPSCQDNKAVKIRLAEIDAPEKAQPGGAESTRSLAGMVLKKRVNVQTQALDKYGRLVAHLAVNGKNVNEEQVRRGMAWEYSSFHSDKTYIALQGEARRARRGLWALPDPTPPWQWRKLHAADAPAAANRDFTCGGKRHCAQMRSCAEARFYLTRCGVKSLDGNGDGVPCENLCADKK